MNQARASAGALRRDAEATVAALPPLLVAASRLAASVVAGVHGRRRAGPGESFWQYRAAVQGDPSSTIDWRRSARSRVLLVRETEWEAAETVWVWSDDAQSMGFRSDAARESKQRRAALLALAVAILLTRSGERVGMLGEGALAAGSGARQLSLMANQLDRPTDRLDYGTPPDPPRGRGGHVVFLSDFLGEFDTIESRLRAAVGNGIQGYMVQIVDPYEEAFPYGGRITFESMGGSVRYRTEAADALVGDYVQSLARLRNRLRDFSRRMNWHFTVHRTDQPALSPLIWLVEAIGDLR